MALLTPEDLQLKTYSVAPTSSTEQSADSKDSSAKELTTYQDVQLKKKLSAVQHELEKTQVQLREEREAFAGSTAGSDKVAKKIVELSKKNRELAAEVARHRSKAKELQETVNKFEAESRQRGGEVIASLAVAASEQRVPPDERERKVDRLEEEVSSLKAKLAGLRNQCQSLKQEVTLTQKVLAREVGEGFSVSELLGGMPGWRGRAQQITNLQNRVAELKRQVKVLEGQRSGRGDLEGGGEKERGRIRQLEQKRRNELELKAGELAELKEKHAEVVRQLAASKARNQTLSSQLKSSLKNQPSTSASSTPLHHSSGSLSGRLPSASSERTESKSCLQCARNKAVYERELARKEKAVDDLKQQLRVVKESERRLTSETRVHSAPGLSLHNDGGTGLTSVPDTAEGVEWSTRAKVAEAEKDKLLEMITLLHQRLDEAVRRIAAGTSSSKSSAQKGRGEAEFGKNVSRNELVERLQLQMDESRALKETLSSYQTAKAQDIKILTGLLKQSRASFAKTVQEITARTQNRQ